MPTSETSAADRAAQREYVASMSRQLAMMARDGGDEQLADLLETAAQIAARGASSKQLRVDA